MTQQRSTAAVAEARAEVDGLLAADGQENVRSLQRAVRDTMTERAGVVRDEGGLRDGLAELDAIEARMGGLGVHPDIAGYHDLAHAFDLKSAVLAARATLETAFERRETAVRTTARLSRARPVVSGQPGMVRSRRIEREAIPPIPDDIAALMRDVSSDGKLVE